MPVPKAGEVLVRVLSTAINPSDGKDVLGKMVRPKRSGFPAMTLPAA